MQITSSLYSRQGVVVEREEHACARAEVFNLARHESKRARSYVVQSTIPERKRDYLKAMICVMPLQCEWNNRLLAIQMKAIKFSKTF